MEVSDEAKRIMVVALGKLYSSRTQRGGLRLHRSLLLTRVMRCARDMYHAAQATTERVASGYEPHHTSQTTVGPDGGPPEPRVTGTHLTSTREEVAGPPGVRLYARARIGAENKENLSPTVVGQHSRKRRATAAVAPDFLPCKRAKLERKPLPQQLSVNPARMDYVHCSSELVAAAPSLQRAIGAC